MAADNTHLHSAWWGEEKEYKKALEYKGEILGTTGPEENGQGIS